MQFTGPPVNYASILSSPLLLSFGLLLPRLGLHLLHLNGVRLTPAHVEVMVAHAQCQDALVDAQTRSIEHKILSNKPKTL